MLSGLFFTLINVRPVGSGGSQPGASPSALGGLALPETCPTLHGRGLLGSGAPRSHSGPRRHRSLRVLPPRRELGGERRPREVSSGLGVPRSTLPRPRPGALSALRMRPHHARLPSPLCHPGSRPRSLPSLAGPVGPVGPVGQEPRAGPAHLMAADAAAKGKSLWAAGSSHYLRRGEPKPHSMIVCISATLFHLLPSHTRLFTS